MLTGIQLALVARKAENIARNRRFWPMERDYLDFDPSYGSKSMFTRPFSRVSTQNLFFFPGAIATVSLSPRLKDELVLLLLTTIPIPSQLIF